MRQRHILRWHWLAPLVSSCVVAAFVVIPPAFSAVPGAPDMPVRSADSILLLLASARNDALSGTILETADLGLPELPSQSTPASGLRTITGFLTGSHTMRIWQDGSDRQRIAVLDKLAETDVARNGATVWTYQSTTNSSTLESLEALSQNEIAQTLLRDVLLPIVTGPDSSVSAGPTARVAGRAAYTLVVRPKRAGTLVDHLEIAVDAVQGTPLRVRLYSVGSRSPSLEVRFTDISYARPAARLFAPVERTPRTSGPTAGEGTTPGSGPADRPVGTIGYGWTAVTEISNTSLRRSAGSALDGLSEPIPGGRVLATPLLSVLLTDKGTIYIGTVPVSRLRTLAGL